MVQLFTESSFDCATYADSVWISMTLTWANMEDCDKHAVLSRRVNILWTAI